MLVTVPPTRTSIWAPFDLAQAFAPRALIQFQETPADLTRSLPLAVRTAPFRWAFGDGTTVYGHTISHRYARPGVYHLQVYGYYRSAGGWFAFDDALVHVVPADQLWQANLEYEAVQTV